MGNNSKMRMKKVTTATLLALSIGIVSANTLSLESNNDGTWNVNFSSDADIAGFQFNIDGVTVLSASGGDAAANGFTVSTSATTVLGFSFTGSVIPAGEGVLTTLEVEGDVDSACIVDLVLSDAGGNGLDAEVVDCLSIVYEVIQLDCEDEDACNFMEPGDCVYPEENYDCDGNCIVDVDCEGECGGDAVVDECGVCNGSGANY